MKKDFFLEEAVLDDLARDLDLLEAPLSEKAFRLVGVIIAILVLAAVAKFSFLGIWKSGFYANRSLINAGKIIPIAAERGLIFDRFGDVLVENNPIYRLSLRLPELLKAGGKEKTIVALENILKISPIEREEIESLINSADLESQDSITLSFDLSGKQAEALNKLDLKSIQVNKDFKRNYFDAEIFSHIFGYVSFADKNDVKNNNLLSLNDSVGKSGLEKYYENELRGENGQIIYYRNAKGEIIDDKFLKNSQKGYDLQTTIDKKFQDFFYGQLKKRLREIGSSRGVGIAINPQNGEILSLVSLPSFNSNKIVQRDLIDANKPLFNRAISGLYSPGSTIKPLVALAALKEKIVSPRDKIFSRGYIEIPNPYYPENPTRYLDWKPHGWVDLYSAIARSSNVYFYSVGGGLPKEESNIVSCVSGDCFKGLGIDKLKEYWRLFELDEKTGVDLPFETMGILPDPESKRKKSNDDWRLGDTYNVSIGQGDLMVTPIGLLNYIAAIANGGKIYKPFIVKENFQKENPQIIKDYSYLFPYIQEVQKAMIDTVAKSYGTANLLSDLPVKVAAKTGTAQIQKNTKINAFFTGYLPTENPQIAILILIEEAKEESSNALPVAKEVLKWYYENRIKTL